MKEKDILKSCSYSLLSPYVTSEMIRSAVALCKDKGVSTLRVPPCYLKTAEEYSDKKVAIAVPVSHDYGWSMGTTKCSEVFDAAKDGADEIEVPINIPYVKDGRMSILREELSSLKTAALQSRLVISCDFSLLTEEEKILVCEAVSSSGADYIMVKNHLLSRPQQREEILFVSSRISPLLKIYSTAKLFSLTDCEDFLSLGASRVLCDGFVK